MNYPNRNAFEINKDK